MGYFENCHSLDTEQVEITRLCGGKQQTVEASERLHVKGIMISFGNSDGSFPPGVGTAKQLLIQDTALITEDGGLPGADLSGPSYFFDSNLFWKLLGT